MAKKTDWQRAFWAMANKCGIYSKPAKKTKKRSTAKKSALKSPRKKSAPRKRSQLDLF